MKEQEIISRIRDKSDNAAELLMRRYRPLIHYVAAPFLCSEQDIEECTNDVVLRVCNNIDTFDPNKGSFAAWITAIARNAALNKVRSYKKDERVSVGLDTDEISQLASPELTPEEAMLKKEKHAIVTKAINDLPRQEKVIFYRRYYYQQPVTQIASELGMTERAIEGRLYRIRKKLRDMIGGEFDD